VVIVGSFTRDLIEGARVIGGPPYYSSMALLHHGCENILIVSPAEEPHLDFVQRTGLELAIVGGSVPVFELKYINNTEREVRLLRRGTRIKLTSTLLDTIKGCAVIVSPVYKEVDLEALQKLREYANVLALDIQGFVRETTDSGAVRIRWSDDVYEALRYADLFHADLSEVPMFRSMNGAAQHLASYTRGIGLISHGEEGLIASIAGELVYVPALPGIQGDSTGTGDILLAITAYELQRGTDPLKAVAMGAAAAGLRVSRAAPPWFSRFEVEILAEKLMMRSRRLH